MSVSELELYEAVIGEARKLGFRAVIAEKERLERDGKHPIDHLSRILLAGETLFESMSYLLNDGDYSYAIRIKKKIMKKLDTDDPSEQVRRWYALFPFCSSIGNRSAAISQPGDAYRMSFRALGIGLLAYDEYADRFSLDTIPPTDLQGSRWLWFVKVRCWYYPLVRDPGTSKKEKSSRFVIFYKKTQIHSDPPCLCG